MEHQNKMEHSKEFADFVTNAVDENCYVGTGNPNAKILFVGKESKITADNLEGRKIYSRNANDWKLNVDNNTCEYLNYPVPKDHELRKGWGRNTWSKYQKLTDIIFAKETNPFHVDFLENVFTTEMNDSPAEKAALADKSSLNKRKELFKNSKFIQQFPVVVLACSDYIKNNNDIREIDDVFKVTVADGKKYTPANWYYLHYNEDKTRLVVHTRQLSANVKPELLEDMGRSIREHLLKVGILSF